MISEARGGKPGSNSSFGNGGSGGPSGNGGALELTLRPSETQTSVRTYGAQDVITLLSLGLVGGDGGSSSFGDGGDGGDGGQGGAGGRVTVRNLGTATELTGSLFVDTFGEAGGEGGAVAIGVGVAAGVVLAVTSCSKAPPALAGS